MLLLFNGVENYLVLWSSDSLFLALNLGATVKNCVFLLIFIPVLQQSQKQVKIKYFYFNICKFTTCWFYPYKFASSLPSKKRKNKGMGNFVIAFCSLCVQCSFCVIVSKLRDLSLICIRTAWCKNMQVLLYILLNLLWFLWFKQMKTSQGVIPAVRTQLHKVSEFVFSLQKCISFYSL